MQTIKEYIQNWSPKKKLIWIAVIALVAYFIIDNIFSGESESGPGTATTSYVEAVSTNDFRTAHEILDNLLSDAISDNASGYYNSDESLEKFWAAADHIYKAEMMYLIEMKDMDANKRLINSLALMNIIGDKPSHKMSAYGGSLTKYDNYQIFVTRFNRICDEILNISILNNNKETAKQILLLYKEDCSPSYKKDGDEDHYYYDFSNSSKNAALKKYNDAVKNGLLN